MSAMGQPNTYSAQWFAAFHDQIDEARTAREVDFITECLPRPEFCRILDACCGTGRHARRLAGSGYVVTGIDRNGEAIARAICIGGGPSYLQGDIRTQKFPLGQFDAAIVMSQSFGYFDEATNRRILQSLANAIRPGGRIILDLWNPAFFIRHQDTRELESAIGTVTETKQMRGNRLVVTLNYPTGDEEGFEWQLFTPAEMDLLAASVGLTNSLSCTNFTRASLAVESNPRIQFLLQKSVCVASGEVIV